ncbi:MAG: O-methyltransferase, partial [Solirubrobacteraceae bacterium]
MLDERVRAVLARLEEQDAKEQDEQRPVAERSLAIAPTSGALLFALCAGRPGCRVLEIGGSRGYSTIWLGAAARLQSGRVTSLEADPVKLALSARNIAAAGLDEWVAVVPGDAFATIAGLAGPFDLVVLDAWKDDYEALFAAARARLVPGGVLVADNVISHRQA